MGVFGKTFHQFNTHQAIDHQTFVFPNGVTVSGGNQTMNCNYQVGNVDVFVRGIKMAESEYTADDGTSVSIPVATLSMTAGDEITIIGRKYPTADIMNSGAVNISGGQVNNTTMNNSTLTNATISSGTFPSDHVIQITTNHSVIRTAIGNQTIKIFESDITLTKANSNLWIDFQTWIGGFSSYQDTDLALAIGWKSGSASSTIGDYTTIQESATTNLVRQQVGSLGVFWNTDTSPVGGSGGQYWHFAFPFRKKIDIGTQSSGATIRVAFWASSDGANAHYVIGGPASGSATDAGGESWLDIWELSA